MLNQIWHHTRNVNVKVMPNRVIYQIPIIGENILKYTKVVYISDYELRVIVDRKPIKDKEFLDRSDMCFLLHTEMK